MSRQTIALSARTAAKLPSIPEINRQLAEGNLDAESRLPVEDLEVMHSRYLFAIVSTHERGELVGVLDKLGLTKYCPHEHIVVSPKGQRQSIDHWREWRDGFVAADVPLAAVIDVGGVIESLVQASDFDGVSKYLWPYAADDWQPIAGSTTITSLRDTAEYQQASAGG